MDLQTYFHRFAENLPKPKLPFPAAKRQIRRLDGDLYETEGAYIAIFDAPGANQSDVQLKYVDGAILVRIDRFRDTYADFEMRLPGRRMSADGRVELPLDASVDPGGATATLTNAGTLRVHLPKVVSTDDAAESTSESP